MSFEIGSCKDGVRKLLQKRAERRIRALEPRRGQIVPLVEENSMPIVVSLPNDPYGYGAGILIENGRLVDCRAEEVIEKYGREFFEREIGPHLRE